MVHRDMMDLDLLAKEKEQAAAQAEAEKAAQAAAQQLLDGITNGEPAPIDFEPVTAETATREDKLFTQDELNHFIRERLAKDRTKQAQSLQEQAAKLDGLAKEFMERENTLNQRQLRMDTISELAMRGLSTDDETLNLVMGSDMETTMQKIAAVHQMKMQQEQPQIPKKDPTLNGLVREVMGLKPKT